MEYESLKDWIDYLSKYGLDSFEMLFFSLTKMRNEA